MKPIAALCLAFSLGTTTAVVGDERPSETPNPIPRNRPEEKKALEALKHRAARLPLPPLKDDERPSVNNGRMAAYYLPSSWRGSRSGRDPAMTLDYAFTTECFWIVSRANNCHY